MDVQTLPQVFSWLSAAILALWAIQSTIDQSAKGMFLTGMAMLALGFGLPHAM